MVASKKMKKPERPYDAFPLFAHANGSWCKKIRGKLWYFGPWNDHETALRNYLNERDAILAGRDPRRMMQLPSSSGVAGCRIVDLCDHFMAAKNTQLDQRQLTNKMFTLYYSTCRLIVEHFGKTTIVESLKPLDFSRFLDSFPKDWGVETLAGVIGRVRSVFKFAVDQDLIDRPVKMGAEFRRPTKLQRRRERQQKLKERGLLCFSSEESLLLVHAAKGWLKACVLLGLNGGFGNSDCSELTVANINFKTGWMDYPRPKTGINRRLCLWPETLTAIREAMSQRPIPNDPNDDSKCFLTAKGNPLVWDRVTDRTKCASSNNLTLAFGKLLKLKGLHRTGHGFYSLRRTFETIAGATKDQVAVDHIMGHDDSSMASIYRQRIDDERLKAVTDHVHSWLFGDEKP